MRWAAAAVAESARCKLQWLRCMLASLLGSGSLRSTPGSRRAGETFHLDRLTYGFDRQFLESECCLRIERGGGLRVGFRVLRTVWGESASVGTVAASLGGI